jgi:hypothetical protein
MSESTTSIGGSHSVTISPDIPHNARKSKPKSKKTKGVRSKQYGKGRN